MNFHIAPEFVPNFSISYSQAIAIWMLLEAAVDVVISLVRLYKSSRAHTCTADSITATAELSVFLTSLQLQAGSFIDRFTMIPDLLILRGRLGWKTSSSEGYLRLIVRLTLQSALITTLIAIVTGEYL